MSLPRGWPASTSGSPASAAGLLREFNEAGVLSAADVQVASRLGRLGETSDETALLGAAFAVRAPRLGHVCVDLATIRATASTDLEEVDLRELRWPAEDEWIARLQAGPLVGAGRPLHLEGTMLYLDRYFSEERQVATDLLALADPPADGVDIDLLASGLERLFPIGHDSLQRLAAASATWTCSASPPRLRCCAAFRSSPAGPARARRPPWRGCWSCSTSRRRLGDAARLSWPWRRRRERRRLVSKRPSISKPARANCGSNPKSGHVSCS